MADLDQQAASLVEYISRAAGNTFNFGHVTSMVYETAWVSLLRSPNDPSTLLFPECNKFILNRQMPGGGWESSSLEIDGIMNTLGGLLALKRNCTARNFGITRVEAESRVKDAACYLDAKLNKWDVITCEHVGFEIIIPSMLEQLKTEGLEFDFPGQDLLIELNHKKLSKIPPSVWSGKTQTTITHSLEAFVGKADFTGLGDQLVKGSMGVSPAASAAYLMNIKKWDPQVEAYLRRVVESNSKDGPDHGGVPDMYSSAGFEVLWIAATLLENGFSASSVPKIGSVLSITQEFYDSMNGLMGGFSKDNVPDADDTAKSILLRNLLCLPTSAESLIRAFEGKSHFLTYLLERHPSITTNCNVLSGLLETPEPRKYIKQIGKTANFLCDSWMRHDTIFKDKWHLSEFYPIMFLVESLTRMVKVWDDGKLPELPEQLLTDKIALVLCQALVQTLSKQNKDGSWGLANISSREITGYSVIALSNLASLPFLEDLLPSIRLAVQRGREYICSTEEFTEFIWIGKSNYSPISVSRAYVLAGLKAHIPKYRMSHKLESLLNPPSKSIHKYEKTFLGLNILAHFPSWKILGSVIEGHIFLNQLKRVRIDMFERAGMKEDKYMDFIAMTFVLANNLEDTFLKSDVLFNFMTLVLRTYQVDEYVEFIISKKFSGSLDELRSIIDQIFEDREALVDNVPMEDIRIYARVLPDYGKTTSGYVNRRYEERRPAKSVPTDADFADVRTKFRAYVNFVIHHPAIQSSSRRDRELLTHLLQDCLHANIDQIEYSRQQCCPVPRGSFYEWVNETAASHSAAPIALSFLRCLLSSPVSSAPRNAEYEFIMEDLWRHISTKCRMENDLGSFKRDRRELNINALDFPEFPSSKVTIEKPKPDNVSKQDVLRDEMQESQRQLQRLIRYERSCIKFGINQLEALVTTKKKFDAHTGNRDRMEIEALKFFFLLSNIYAEVYQTQNISCENQAAIV